MKKFAIGAAFAGALALVMQLAVAPAFAHGGVPNSVPANTPEVIALSPSTSTHVAPGATYSPHINAQHLVAGPPGIWFDYASPEGTDTGLFLNPETGVFTVPSTWAAGTYRLKNVYISDGGASGLHQRDGEFVGFPATGGPEFGSFWLNLPALDLQVS